MLFISKDELALFKKVLKTLIEFKPQFIVLFIVTVCGSIVELIPLYYNGKVIDYIVQRNINQIISVAIIILVLFIISSVFSYFETYLSSYMLNKANCILKNRLFSHIIKIKINYFEKKQVGEYISRLEGDVGTISSFFIQDILKVIIDILSLIVSGFFIFKISPVMSVLILLSFPISAIIYFFFGKKIRINHEKAKKINDNYYSFVQEVFYGIREIKNLKSEKHMENKFEIFMDTILKLQTRLVKINIFSGLCGNAISTIVNLMLIIVGAYLIIYGHLTIGLYVAFNSYMNKFMSSLYSITAMNINIQQTIVSLKRMNDILDTEIDDYTDYGKNLIEFSGRVKIKELFFKYDTNMESTLEGVNLVLPPKSISAIVGLSGCGKTTLLNILNRFYDSFNGEIYFDEMELRDINLNSIRSNVSYIEQNPMMFNTSIKENLLYANPNATDSEIHAACEKANISNFINDLPDKYDTIINKNIISGGQRQRLAIARAILKNSKLYLFDEITSDLDGESENIILKTINQLAADSTVLIIAHRLSTVINIPNIFVLDGGKISDMGDHDKLIKESYIYKRLFKDQWNEYIKKIEIKGDENDNS